MCAFAFPLFDDLLLLKRQDSSDRTKGTTACTAEELIKIKYCIPRLLRTYTNRFNLHAGSKKIDMNTRNQLKEEGVKNKSRKHN